MTTTKATINEKAANEKAANETATGRTAIGRTAIGRSAAGKSATGETATGETATGEAATGKRATGEAATGETATGEAATGKRATGEAATGETATGETATGETATGRAVIGEAASGRTAVGGPATGRAIAGEATAGPRLEDGVSAITPAGDNLLADFVAAEGAAYRAIAEQAGGRAVVDDELGLSLGDAGSPSYFGNVAYLARPLVGSTAREAVRRVRAFYAAGQGGPFLLFTPWSLGDLRGEGFELAGHPPFMVRPPGSRLRDGGSAADSAADPAPDRADSTAPGRAVGTAAGRADSTAAGRAVGTAAGRAVGTAAGRADSTAAGRAVGTVDLRWARSPRQVGDFDQTLAEAFPEEDLLPYGSQQPLFTEGLLDTPWRLVVAYLGDLPIATAAAYVTDRVVAVEAVSTRSAFRGRGIGAAVTRAAALADPALPTALLSSDPGRPVYERLGFLPIMRFTLWIGRR